MWLTALPPASRMDGDFKPALPLPDPGECAESLKGSSFAREVTDLAEEIRAHRFPIFGKLVDAGPEIHWRRDYTRGVDSGLVYFRRIPFLDTPRAGDHKIIWELNRHQHLVVLAQAYLLTGDSGKLGRDLRATGKLDRGESISSWNQLGECARSGLPRPFLDLD